MARLIDANALLKVLRHRVKGNEDSPFVIGTNNTLDIFADFVQSIPTVDAVPVVYGRWVAYPDEYQICATEFVCSNCNTSFVNSELASDNDFLEMMKFCPNCGAKMDGDEDDK